jgi:hypothetical protein
MEYLKPVPDLNTRRFQNHPEFCRRPHIILRRAVLVLGFWLQHILAAVIARGRIALNANQIKKTEVTIFFKIII